MYPCERRSSSSGQFTDVNSVRYFLAFNFSVINRFLLFAVLLVLLSIMPAKAEDLLVYTGTTFKDPVSEIAKALAKKLKVSIRVHTGSSADLYQQLKKSRQGDLYLPGASEFRQRNLAEGLLGDYVTVGYNQLALITRKGNPKRIKADPHELLRDDINMVIGSAERGAVGLASKRMLESLGIYQEVLERATQIAPISDNLTRALKKNEADVTLNFRVTAFLPENRTLLEVIDLAPAITPFDPLQLSLLTFSSNPSLARQFMHYAISAEGQRIFQKYGLMPARLPAP